MKILVVTNMYPKKDQPYYGIFVKEQVEGTRKILGDENVGCLFLDGKNALQKYVFSFFSLWKKYQKLKPDIIHMHFGLSILPVLFLYPLLKYHQCKLILTTHGGDVIGHYPITRFITRVAIALSDHIINVSQQTHQLVNSLTKHCIYIPCGITDEFTASTVAREKIVVFPSSPKRHEKNYPLFCSIIDKVKLLHSEPFDVAVLEDLSRTEVAALLQKSACMLMTSDYEGSPQAVKEAILCGLPVVSTPAGDVPLLLEDYKACAVSTSEDELSKAVNHFLVNHQKGFSYNKALINSLSNANICQKIVKCYKSLISP